MISFVPGQRPNESSPARPVKPQVAERFVAASDGPEESSSASAMHEADAPQAADEPRSFPKIFIAVGILLVLLVGGAVAVNRMLPQEQNSTQSGPPITASDDPKDALIGGTVPTVENFKYSTVGKTVTFRWENPEPNQGDSYRWAPITATDKGKVQQTKSTSATTAIAQGGQTCIEVKLVRDDGRISEASKFCTG